MESAHTAGAATEHLSKKCYTAILSRASIDTLAPKIRNLTSEPGDTRRKKSGYKKVKRDHTVGIRFIYSGCGENKGLSWVMLGKSDRRRTNRLIGPGRIAVKPWRCHSDPGFRSGAS
jgi:hypothetical protein